MGVATLLALLLISGVVITAFNLGRVKGAQSLGGAMQAAADLSAIKVALEMYYEDAGVWPSQAEGLGALLQPVHRGPFLRADVVTDPWGRPYIYAANSRYARPSVCTLGADGIIGGNGADSDFCYYPVNVVYVNSSAPASCPTCGGPIPNQKIATCPGCQSILRRLD